MPTVIYRTGTIDMGPVNDACTWRFSSADSARHDTNHNVEVMIAVAAPIADSARVVTQPLGPRWVEPINLFCGALVSVVPCLLGESQVRFV
jgi:hypothetical protein